MFTMPVLRRLFSVLSFGLALSHVQTIRADEGFAVISTVTDDGFSSELFSVDSQNIHEFNGVLSWAETDTIFPLTVNIEDPEQISELVESVEAFEIPIEDGSLQAKLLYERTWDDSGVEQLIYDIFSETGEQSRSGQVQITHDPWPVAVMVVFGAAVLACSANHQYTVYSQGCPHAEMELTIVPPSCKTSCRQ